MPMATIEQQREFQQGWLAKRRAEWFAGKVCAHCGSPDRLELDHIDPLVKISHSVWSWTKVRRDAELAKCQPLCHDCHKVKTAEFLAPPHGTSSRYTSSKWRCRCSQCRAANTSARRTYRATGRYQHEPRAKERLALAKSTNSSHPVRSEASSCSWRRSIDAACSSDPCRP